MNLTFLTERDLLSFETDTNWIFEAFPALHYVRYKTFRSVAPNVCVSHSTTRWATSFVAVWEDNYSEGRTKQQKSDCIKSVYSASNQLHQHSARATGGSWRKSKQRDQLCVSQGHTHILLLWLFCFILKRSIWQERGEKLKSDVFFFFRVSSSISEWSWILPEPQILEQSALWSLRVASLRGPCGEQPAFKVRKPTIRPELKP